MKTNEITNNRWIVQWILLCWHDGQPQNTKISEIFNKLGKIALTYTIVCVIHYVHTLCVCVCML